MSVKLLLTKIIHVLQLQYKKGINKWATYKDNIDNKSIYVYILIWKSSIIKKELLKNKKN